MFYVSGSKLMSPDNKFLWCPSGTYLSPNVTYFNAQGGVNPDNIHLAVQVNGTSKVMKYLDVIPVAYATVVCELY